MNRPRRFFVACLTGLSLALASVAAPSGPEDAAQAAAESWLGQVDAGDYAGSWAQAAPPFKSAVKQAEWSEAAANGRGSLGALVSRKLKSREYTEKAPATRLVGGKVYTLGAGKFVVLQYDSAFANKGSASETVVAMEASGAWRVASYSVR
jgi:hypothetical protein